VAGTVGFAGVCHPETPGVDQELVPGLSYVGRGRLRVGSNAEMAGQTGGLPTLIQSHVLGVANATCGVLGAAPGGGSIGSGFIGFASATMVSESDEVVFVRTSYDLDVGRGDQEEAESDNDMAFPGNTIPEVQPTPAVRTTDPQTVAESTTASIRVGHIFAAANATQGHTAGQSGFGTQLTFPANAQTICAVLSVPLMRKRILVANVAFNPDASTTDVTRLFITAGANAVMGHIATPSGVTDNFINSVPAIQGHTATPGDATILHRTFPEASEDGMIVNAPTMTQNVVDPETGVTAASIFGTGISTTSEGAIPIGSTGTHPNTTAVAIRFKSKRTSTLTSARVSLRGSGGNSLGQPLLEARILRDDNTSLHKPVDSQRTAVTTNGNQVTYTGTSAHVGSVSDLVSADTTLGRFTFVWSSGAPSLVRNVLYHLELRNVHSNPGSNWTSLDTLVMSPAQSPSQPSVLDTDLAVLQRSTSGVWSAQSQNTPIFSLGYADGRNQGQAYLWAPNTPNYSVTGPLNKVRETFVPTQNLRVHKIAARAGRWSGAQPLQIRLIRESNGATLASAAVDSGYFPLIDQAASDFRTSHRWYAHSFVSSFALSAGVTAAVELQTTANTEYRVNHLDPQDTTLPLSATFREGRAQYTVDGGTVWINASSRTTTTTTDFMFYLGLGSAAQRPVCSADSFDQSSGFIIGNTRTVSARELILNDTNPSGTHSATTNFPTGVNPLVINHANSASNCTVVMSTAAQTIAVSTKASSASFTYVARDIYGQRSSARVSISARSTAATPTPPNELIIYYSGKGTQLSSTVLAAYNARRALNVNPPQIYDENGNGIWDGSDGFNGRTAANGGNFSLVTSNTSVAALDWEGANNITYAPDLGGINLMRLFARADSGYTAAQQARLAHEYTVALNGWQAARPNCRFGYYGLPYYASNGGGPFASSLSGNILTQASNNVIELWNDVAFISPRAYISYDETGSPGAAAPTCTEAQALQMQANVAELAIRVAQLVEPTRGYIPIYPYVSLEVFNATPDHEALSLEWIYTWVKGLTTPYNGRTIDGVIFWTRAAGPFFDEGHLKAVYQGLHGLTFNPNAPRPT
jgi:hypothetical protein